MRVSVTVYNNQFADIPDGPVYVNPNPQESRSVEAPVLTRGFGSAAPGSTTTEEPELDEEMLLDEGE